jgi:hypothetical protein
VPDATPSITSWTRLEPRCRDAEMRSTVSARVFDPLWLMTRQWQVGEFQGEMQVLPCWRASVPPRPCCRVATTAN